MSKKPAPMVAAPVPSSDIAAEIFSIRELRDILFRRRATIFTVTGLVTLLAVAYAAWKGPVYTATASVLIEPATDNQRSTIPSIIDTQRDIISSPTLIEATMTDLNLYDVDEYKAESSSFTNRISDWMHTPASWFADDTATASADARVEPDSSTNRISGWMHTLASWFADDTATVSADAKAQEALDRDQSEAIFARNLRVTHSGESLILDINFKARDPDRAANVANHLADLYLQHRLSRKQEAAQQIEEWLSARVANMRAQVLDAERKLADYRAQHQFQLDQVAARSTSAVMYQELEREAEAKRATYSTMLSRYYDSWNSVGALSANARLISRATTPTKPSSMSGIVVAAVSLIASCLFGCALALLQDRMNQRLWNGRQIEAVLGARCLGLVPGPERRTRRARGDGIPPAGRQASYDEAVWSIGLRIATVNPVPRSLLVTSLVPEQERSCFAADLAGALCRTVADRVLLVDFDLSTETTGAPSPVDGHAVTTKKGEPAAFLRRDAKTGIDILPAVATALAEQMPSRRLATNLLKALQPSYDVIVINAPALLVAPEAKVLAMCVDTTVLVAEWGRTELGTAGAGLALLRDIGAPLLGVVLAQADLRQIARQGNGHDYQYFGSVRRYADR
ncbi:MAG TPA: Wzz/FepE/Etk N-terminal domain-containing protein [Woeseiaceae bacterium]|nr:Wzz/FepE/Etk N-terminal domain-containing protein [Woeseiaceae bacterium]